MGRLSLGVTGVALSLALLTGCSAPPPAGAGANAAAARPTTTPSPTPTIPVGPVALTEEEAAGRYLTAVCQRNLAANALNSAFQASEDEFINGGTPDVGAVRAAAGAQMEANRAQVEVLDDAYFVWPAAVVPHLKAVRDAAVAELSPLSEIVNAPSYEVAYYMSWPDTTDARAASQEVRIQLNLDADTTKSCAGYETAATEAVAAMNVRDEYIASFTAVD
jgi:hypothetical protein